MVSDQFRYQFTSTAGEAFEITPLKTEDVPEAAKIMTEGYLQMNPLRLHLQITIEQLYPYIEIRCFRSIEDKLAIVCKDTKTSKIVGAAIFFDQYRELNEPVDYSKASSTGGQENEFQELMKYTKARYIFRPSKPYEIISFGNIAVDTNYAKQKIAKELNSFALRVHPIISQARLGIVVCTNPITEGWIKEAGWKIENVVELKDYKNSKGVNPFERLRETADKIGFNNYERVVLLSGKIKPTPSL